MDSRLIAWCLLMALPQAALGAQDRLVLLVEDQSAEAAAAREIVPALTALISRKGYEVVAGSEADKAAAEASTGHLESLSPPAAASLLGRFHAERVLIVTIRFLLTSHARERGPSASPAVGLTAKAFSRERVIWRNALGFIDDEPERPGRKPRPLAFRACARLLWSFPRGSGATVASVAEEFEDVTGVLAQHVEKVPDYAVQFDRLRAARTGPQFRLRMSQKQ
jgi:hypothetical protein